MIRAICALCVAAQLGACTTLQPVTASPNQGVSPEDDVRIVTQAGRELRFRVTRVSADEVCGDRECVPTADIARAERREVDAVATIGLVLLIVAIVVGIGAAVAASSVAYYY